MKKLTVAAFVVLLAACGGGKTVYEKAKVPKTITMVVDGKLSGAANVRGDLSKCVGIGKFADVVPGAKATVRNQNGKVLAVGVVRLGLGTDYFRDLLDQCDFRIAVYGVPRAKSYTIQVAGQTPQAFSRFGLVATNGVFPININPPLVTVPTTPTTTTTTRK